MHPKGTAEPETQSLDEAIAEATDLDGIREADFRDERIRELEFMVAALQSRVFDLEMTLVQGIAADLASEGE